VDLEKEFEVERSFREMKRWSAERHRQIEQIIRDAGFEPAPFVEYYRTQTIPADVDRVAFLRAVVQIDKLLLIDPQ